MKMVKNIWCLNILASELVIECFEEISPVAQEKEVEFVYKDNGLNTIIEADRVDMKTVVLNLLSNAVMYSNHNEQVTVNIEVSTNHIQVEITSRGITLSERECSTMLIKLQEKCRNTRQLGME